MGLGTDEVTEVLPSVDDDISEFDGKAHYVRTKSLIESAGVQVALCGKKWIPQTIAQAQNYPVCKPCDELFGLLQSMG